MLLKESCQTAIGSSLSIDMPGRGLITSKTHDIETKGYK
jgi:hypothetical protein